MSQGIFGISSPTATRAWAKKLKQAALSPNPLFSVKSFGRWNGTRVVEDFYDPSLPAYLTHKRTRDWPNGRTSYAEHSVNNPMVGKAFLHNWKRTGNRTPMGAIRSIPPGTRLAFKAGMIDEVEIP